jgi:nicotinamidase/pyrazinamidase
MNRREKSIAICGDWFASDEVAAFDVDATNCFTPVCPDELPVPGGTDIVAELNAQALLADYRVGSKDAHSPNAIWVADAEHPQFSPVEGKNVDIRWKVHSVPGTKGFELIEGLPPVTDYDFMVYKGVEPDMHPYGACYHDLGDTMSTGVIEWLHSAGVKVVIVGGLATDYCVKTTVLQLLRAQFEVVVNIGACRGIIVPEGVDAAIKEMAEAGAVVIQSASEIPWTT